MEKRNLHAGLLVYLLMAVGVAVCATGCASTASTLDAGEVEDGQVEDGQVEEAGQLEEPHTAYSGPGPFEVAVDWASTVATKPPPKGLRQVVGQWKVARVARVWAAGDEYRAVVVQKNTARETLAVLVHIARSQSGEWEVTGTEPTTSTHLWSEL